MSFCAGREAALFVRNRPWSDTFCRLHSGQCRQKCIIRDLALPHFPSVHESYYTFIVMTISSQPNVKLSNASDYRESYANSVQMRVNVWDFFMVFGTLQQQSESQVEIRNFQGIYLSPQQAKALLGLLQQNVSGYESAFGEIKLDPRLTPAGPVH
jgi:Protein of unknown function (DUF3467)